jgi:hyperosmotically inducible periplasmic protein
MNRKQSQAPRLSVIAAVAALGLALAACQDKPAEPTVGQRVDGAIASAERKAEEIKADMKDGANKAQTAVGDAAITAAVNAKLAADSELSALRINVDTRDGRVTMSGDAPTLAARQRATELARSVDGVRDVGNSLTIQGKQAS